MLSTMRVSRPAYRREKPATEQRENLPSPCVRRIPHLRLRYALPNAGG